MTIRELIQEMAGNGEEIYSIVARVTEVDETERTCSVQPLNGDPELFGVWLQAALEMEKGVVLFPKVDSKVVVTFLNRETGFVSVATDFDKVQVNSDECEVVVDATSITMKQDSGHEIFMDGGGVKISSKTDNLWVELERMLTALHTMTMPTAWGPSGLSDKSPDFIDIKTKIGTILQ